jgi:hypothetical protein
MVSRAMLDGRAEALLKLVRHVEPRLERLEILAPQGVSRVYGVVAGRPVLWSHFGAGVQRALTYGLDLIRAKGGVLLIDELETGIHWTALREVCAWLARSANELDVQVFATTHSVETVDALIEASRGDADELVLFHLERSNGAVSVQRYGEELLDRVRFERGLEVR